MKAYLAILSARFRTLLQYRAAALAGLWTQIFFGLVLIMVYEAFYRSTSATQPISFRQVVDYTWLGQALLAMLPWNIDPDARTMVRSGAVAYELCRPVDLYGLWYTRAMAHRTASTILRAVPMTIIAMIIFPLIGLGDWRLAPPTLASGLCFVPAILLCLLLGCAISAIVNITLIWTLHGDGIAPIVTAVVVFFSGMLMPLPLFPDWAQPILRWLPFAGLIDLPFRTYTGNIAPAEVPIVLLRMAMWTVILILFGRWLLGRGLRRIVVQGG